MRPRITPRSVDERGPGAVAFVAAIALWQGLSAGAAAGVGVAQRAAVRPPGDGLPEHRQRLPLRPVAAARPLSARVVPVQDQARVLPAVLGRDGAAAADGRRPDTGRDRLYDRQPRQPGRHVPGRRHRRPRLGRGLVPDLRLGHVRPHPGQRSGPRRHHGVERQRPADPEYARQARRHPAWREQPAERRPRQPCTATITAAAARATGCWPAPRSALLALCLLGWAVGR